MVGSDRGRTREYVEVEISDQMLEGGARCSLEMVGKEG